jgi:hypothetical protein
MIEGAVTDRQMVAKLRSACDAAGGVRPWARKNGVSPGTVQDILSGRNDMSESIGNKLGLIKRSYWFPFSPPRKDAAGG